MDKKSQYGYATNSPYRRAPYLDIFTPEGLIDMSNTDIPLYAQDETGYGKILPPYSGMHQFNGTKVREHKLQVGGTYQNQAQVDAANLFAKDFSTRRNYINPGDSYVARKPGDPVVQFNNVYTRKPYQGEFDRMPQSMIKPLPDWVTELQWDHQWNQPYYLEGNDINYVDTKWYNSPKFVMSRPQQDQFIATRDKGGRYQQGGSIQDLIDYFWEDDEPAKKQEDFHNTAPDDEEIQNDTPEDDSDQYDEAMNIAMETPYEYRRSGRQGRMRTPVGYYEDSDAIPLDVNSSGQQAYQYYLNKGLDQHVAAGIVGNLMQESGLNPYARGDNGQATGVAQWHPDRFRGLQTWARSQGRDPYALDTQLDYVLVEANQRGDLQHVQNASNSAEAAYRFAQQYERPKVIDNKRIGYAKSLNPYK